MLPIRWEPFRAFDRDPFFKMFDELFPRFGTNPVDDDRAGMRVVESDDAYVVEAVVPGYGPEHLQIWVEGDTLRIEGERADQARGLVASKVKRVLSLPAGRIERDRVEATIEHGVVSVRLPKLEVARARRIDVKPGTGIGQKLADTARRLFKKDEETEPAEPAK